MPLCLYVSRVPVYARIRDPLAPAPTSVAERVRGWWSGGTPPTAPLAMDEVEAWLATGPASRTEPGCWRVRRPDTDEPWFLARCLDGGHVRLAISWSGHRFLRDAADVFDFAMRLAEALDARVFEEVGGTEVTEDVVDRLLAPDGPYVGQLAETWAHVLRQMNQRLQAPLEYPVGEADAVSEFLLFSVRPQGGFDALRDLPHGLVAAHDGDRGLLSVPGEKHARVKVMRDREGAVRLWPSWLHRPFVDVAAPTIDTVAALVERGGRATWHDRPVTPELLAEMRARAGGLGVDFWGWAQSLA